MITNKVIINGNVSHSRVENRIDIVISYTNVVIEYLGR